MGERFEQNQEIATMVAGLERDLRAEEYYQGLELTSQAIQPIESATASGVGALALGEVVATQLPLVDDYKGLVERIKTLRAAHIAQSTRPPAEVLLAIKDSEAVERAWRIKEAQGQYEPYQVKDALCVIGAFGQQFLNDEERALVNSGIWPTFATRPE